MIIIYYQPGTNNITAWKDKLEEIFLSHQFIVQEGLTTPRLLDGQIEVNGASDIDNYLSVQIKFQEDWYEDRCDKYERGADPLSQMINSANDGSRT